MGQLVSQGILIIPKPHLKSELELTEIKIRLKGLDKLEISINLVGLKGESEFIPINSPGENNEFNNEGNNSK